MQPQTIPHMPFVFDDGGRAEAKSIVNDLED